MNSSTGSSSGDRMAAEGRSATGVKPSQSRSRKVVRRSTKAPAKTSAISRNPSARKRAEKPASRNAKAGHMSERAGAAKAAAPWEARARQGGPAQRAHGSKSTPYTAPQTPYLIRYLEVLGATRRASKDDRP